MCGQGSREFGSRSNIELAVYAGQMGFDGPLAHEQFGSDLGVGATGGNQVGDAAFGAGQACACRIAA
jgi:hypothetical protein